jgi:hypothetical protein
VTPNEYEEKKKKYESLKAQATKAEGARDQLLETLRKDFDISEIDEAVSHLSTLEKQLFGIEESIAREMEELENVVDWNTL